MFYLGHSLLLSIRIELIKLRAFLKSKSIRLGSICDSTRMEYEVSFIVNQDGKVYEKDLGEDTNKAVQKMTSFKPGQNMAGRLRKRNRTENKA